MKTKLSVLFAAMMPIFSFAQTKAVSIFDRGSVFVAPDRTSTPVGTIRFGVDVVEMTLETIQQEKTTFVKVILADGTTGYISKYLLVPNGEGAVIAQNTGIYQNPVDNVTMVRNKEFMAGEPVVFTELSGPYAYVVGHEKKKEGWVLISNLITGNDEVRAATMYAAALREPNMEKRTKALKHLTAQSQNLKIYPLIEAAYADAQNGVSPTYVSTEPAPANPTAPDDQGRATVSRGNENKKVPEPNKETPSAVYVSRGSKHVETVEVILVEVENEKPFACYHKTLPIGTKIKIRIPDNAGFMEFEVVGRLTNYEGIGLTQKTAMRVLGENYPNTATIEYAISK